MMINPLFGQGNESTEAGSARSGLNGEEEKGFPSPKNAGVVNRMRRTVHEVDWTVKERGGGGAGAQHAEPLPCT